MHKTLFALLIAGLVVCAGCKREDADPTPGDRTDKPSVQAGAEEKGTADDAWDNKVEAYIDVGNRLRDFNGPAINETFARWAAESRAKVAAGDFKEISSKSSTLSEHNMTDLKEAIAMPGKTPELDQAAQALVSAAEKYLPGWNELLEYNKAKRYEDDGGAKGRELLVNYKEGLPKLELAVDALSARIDAAAKIAHEKTLARFKAEGKLLEMHTWEAMGSAEKIIDLFDEPEDFKNKATVDQANAHLAAMESGVVALRAEHVKRKADRESLPSMDNYESIASKLTTLAGEYREARKDPANFNDVVKTYNDAVDDLNRMN